MFESMKERMANRKWRIDGKRLIFKNVICNGTSTNFKRMNYADIDSYAIDHNDIKITTCDNRLHVIHFENDDGSNAEDLGITLEALLS